MNGRSIITYCRLVHRTYDTASSQERAIMQAKESATIEFAQWMRGEDK